METAYSGGYPGLLFGCHKLVPHSAAWSAEMNAHPAKALDIHMFSSALRNVMFSPPIVRFLGLLFECLPITSQTLG